jgi:predicted Na+-dependent transporter
MEVVQLVNLLAAVTLSEMMVTLGLGVRASDVMAVGKQWELLSRALLANYVIVPGAAFGLLLLFHTGPMVAAGFLVAAVCPGGAVCSAFHVDSQRQYDACGGIDGRSIGVVSDTRARAARIPAATSS